ncbi:hypothetical protein CASFOL_001346 [Castilleja foliolosa]|uniref:Uncharacterized protein n=1 Tax=Castilleja foliolosa TaxID=1961234 RepID=A0ABD3EMB0_9LAMI
MEAISEWFPRQQFAVKKENKKMPQVNGDYAAVLGPWPGCNKL